MLDNLLKGMPGNLQDIFGQAAQLQEKMQKLQQDLAQHVTEASAGGGMVTAKVSGKSELLELTIDKTVVSPDDVEMLQDLVRAAVNEALRRSREHTAEEMQKLTGGLPISIPGFGG